MQNPSTSPPRPPCACTPPRGRIARAAPFRGTSGPEPIRLFAALYPSPDALDAALHLVDTLPDPGSSRPTLAWVPRDLLHVTAAFYGVVPPGAVDDLADRLAEVVRDHDTMTAHLRGAGVFSDRVLWLGVGGDTDAVHALSVDAACAGADAGLHLDRRPRHRAHLTVARARHVARARPRRGHRGGGESPAAIALARYAEALSIYVGPSWTPAELCLVESDLADARPVHRVVERFALG